MSLVGRSCCPAPRAGLGPAVLPWGPQHPQHPPAEPGRVWTRVPARVPLRDAGPSPAAPVQRSVAAGSWPRCRTRGAQVSVRGRGWGWGRAVSLLPLLCTLSQFAAGIRWAFAD